MEKNCTLPVRRFGRHCRGIQILLHFTYNLTHQYLTTKNTILFVTMDILTFMIFTI